MQQAVAGPAPIPLAGARWQSKGHRFRFDHVLAANRWPLAPRALRTNAVLFHSYAGDDDNGLGQREIVGDGEVDPGFVALRRDLLEARERPPGQGKGRPAGRQVDDPHVPPEHALANPVPSAFGAGLLGGEALGIGGRAGRPPVGLGALDGGEDAVEEAVAVALDRLLDAADVDEVVAEADDHELIRGPAPGPWRRASARMVSAKPTKIASPTRKWPMLSSASSGRPRCARRWRSRGRARHAARGRGWPPARRPALSRSNSRSALAVMPVGDRSHQVPVCSSTTGRPELRRAPRSPRVGLDEERDADAGIVQPGDVGRQMVVPAHHIEPALGGALLALLRHQADGVRLDARARSRASPRSPPSRS